MIDQPQSEIDQAEAALLAGLLLSIMMAGVIVMLIVAIGMAG